MSPRKKRKSNKLKSSLDENKNKNLVTPKNTPQSEIIDKVVEKLNENDIPNSENNSATEIHKTQIVAKQPIVAPNGKMFYPCQHCSKIFPREATYKTHMGKCSGKNKSQLNLNLHITNNNNIENTAEAVNKYSNEINQSMIAPDGKTFYPCQYCSKIFPREITYTCHMEKCSKKNNSNVHVEESVPKNGDSITASIHIASEDTPNRPILEESVDTPVPQKAKYDISIYDYDEEDSPDESPRINTDTKCKICPFTAETAIDLLRHKREVHKVLRKILPPHEIQKYFDYPDRTFCPICEQPIKSRNFRSIFVKHLLVHTAGLTYECKICKKKFRRIDHMRTHEKRHVLTFAELQAIQDTIDNRPADGLSFILSN